MLVGLTAGPAVWQSDKILKILRIASLGFSQRLTERTVTNAFQSGFLGKYVCCEACHQGTKKCGAWH